MAIYTNALTNKRAISKENNDHKMSLI